MSSASGPQGCNPKADEILGTWVLIVLRGVDLLDLRYSSTLSKRCRKAEEALGWIGDRELQRDSGIAGLIDRATIMQDLAGTICCASC